MCGSSLQAFHRGLPCLLIGNAILVSTFILLQDHIYFSLLYKLFKGTQKLGLISGTSHPNKSPLRGVLGIISSMHVTLPRCTVLTAWSREGCVGCGSAGNEAAAPGLFQFSKPPPPNTCFVLTVPFWWQALRKERVLFICSPYPKRVETKIDKRC